MKSNTLTKERIEIMHTEWHHGRCSNVEYTCDVFKQSGEFYALRIYISVERGVGNFHLQDGVRYASAKESKARAHLKKLLGVDRPGLDTKHKRNRLGERMVIRQTPYNPSGTPSCSTKISATYHRPEDADISRTKL